MKANATTGLAADDVFMFGNAIAETGNHAAEPAPDAIVDTLDEQAIHDHYTATAAIDSPYDVNRDGVVDAADEAIAAASHSGANTLTLMRVLQVGPTDWTGDGLTLERTGDGLLHLYHTADMSDAVVPQVAASVTSVSVTGRNDAADMLAIDFSGGNPIPSGGVSYNGGLGTNANFLVIADAGRSDTLTMTATQLMVNGSSVVNLANVQGLSLDLGADKLDLGGTTQTVGSVTLVSGQITHGTLNAAAYTILGGTVSAQLGPGNLIKQSTGPATVTTPINATSVNVQAGQLTATSIVADTLVIGAGSSVVIAETVPPGSTALLATTASTPVPTSTDPVPVLTPVTPMAAVAVPVTTVSTASVVVGPLPPTAPQPSATDAALALASPTLPIATSPSPAQKARVLPSAATSVAASASLDHLGLLLALERSATELSAQRRLWALDTLLAEGTSFLADSPDMLAPANPVRRRTGVRSVNA